MNPDDLRAYKKRWEMVAALQCEEVARMSPAQKFADTCKLMQVARALGGSTDEEDEGVEQVRRRWNLLAERMAV